MDEEWLHDVNEWFTWVFIMILRNTNALSEEDSKEDEDSVSLFPMYWNHLFSEEEKSHLQKEEITYHQCVNHINFVWVDLDAMNWSGMGYYPPFAYSVSLWQMMNLKYFADVMIELIDEDSEYSKDITLVIKDECITFLFELYCKLIDILESVYLHESVIRMLFIKDEN